MYICVRTQGREERWNVTIGGLTHLPTRTPFVKLRGINTGRENIDTDIEQEQPYFLVEDKKQAITLCEALSTRTPGITWTYANIEGTFFAPPGTPRHTQFTEKGAIPG